jgi:hypothetical protein
MSKTVTAGEPAERTHAEETTTEPPPGEHPWDKFRGILSVEAGEELARIVEEMFPTER